MAALRASDRSSAIAIACGALLFLVFIYGEFLAFASLQGFPLALQSAQRLPYLADKPIGEDGFYMLMAAWHFGTTGHLVANFGVPVSGIQPLATFLYAGLALLVTLFAGSDANAQWSFLRVIVGFNVALLLAFACAMRNLALRIFSSAIRVSAGWLAAAIVVTSFYLFRAFTYGLETGLYLLLLTGCLLAWLCLCEVPSTQNKIRFALLLGLTTLARIDFIVVAFVALTLAVARRAISLRTTFFIATLATMLLLPWLAWIYIQTGTPIPSSGSAQAAIISLSSILPRLGAAGAAVSQVISPMVPDFGRLATTIVAPCVCFLGFASGVLYCMRPPAGPHSPIFEPMTGRVLIPWCVGLLTLIPVYIAFFWATHFYSRYLAPLALIGILAWSGLLAASVGRNSAHPRRFAISVFGVLACIFAFAVVNSLHTGRIGNSHAVTAGIVSREMRSGRVGAFQSGVIGFFNSNVENLDGKVNFQVLPYIKAGDLTPYVRTHHFDWIVDWPGYINRYISADFMRRYYVACTFQIPNGGLSVCFRARSAQDD